MAGFDTTRILEETVEHAKTLGIDEITFDPTVRLTMLDFVHLVQTFRLAEGDPTRLAMPTGVRGGRYDLVILDEATTRTLHVRNPITPEPEETQD